MVLLVSTCTSTQEREAQLRACWWGWSPRWNGTMQNNSSSELIRAFLEAVMVMGLCASLSDGRIWPPDTWSAPAVQKQILKTEQSGTEIFSRAWRSHLQSYVTSVVLTLNFLLKPKIQILRYKGTMLPADLMTLSGGFHYQNTEFYNCHFIRLYRPQSKEIHWWNIFTFSSLLLTEDVFYKPDTNSNTSGLPLHQRLQSWAAPPKNF